MLRYSPFIKRIVVYSIYALWFLIILSFFTPMFPWGTFENIMGEAAMGMLAIVTLPGILKRFEVTGSYKQLQLLLMSIRRQTGDLMFTLAMAHAVWMRILLYIRFGLPALSSIPLFQVFGTLALFLLFPLFLTSNNFSIRLLKKSWQRVHSLIYVGVWFAAAHALLGEEGKLWGILALCLGLAQIASWLYVYTKKQRK